MSGRGESRHPVAYCSVRHRAEPSPPSVPTPDPRSASIMLLETIHQRPPTCGVVICQWEYPIRASTL